jgi:hypothetical protein
MVDVTPSELTLSVLRRRTAAFPFSVPFNPSQPDEPRHLETRYHRMTDARPATPTTFHTKSQVMPGSRNDPNKTSQKSEKPKMLSTTPATIEILAYGRCNLRDRMAQTIPIAIHVHPSTVLNS